MKKLNLTGIQYCKLNQYWDGTEACPECGYETDFIINPIREIHFRCQHCGYMMVPCSLCDGARRCNGEDCQQQICEELWDWNYGGKAC